MAGRSTRRTRSGFSLPLLCLAALAAAVLSGCSTASGDPSIAVPTFPTADPSRPAPGAEPIKIALPDDCAQLMSVEQAGALFAQPIGAVSVKTIRGVPEPSVKRTERVACTYRATGQGDTGPVLYQLNIGRYADAAAASQQWRSNTNAERADATSSKDTAVGDAPAVLVERPDESMLAVSYGVDTLTFVLPKAAPGQNRPAAEALPDLAQRIIPALAPTQPPGSRLGAAAPAPQPAAPAGRP
ncbi:MAG: hypothetical protein M3235_07860 [Actinomycetota bacterium]|nr:hypothetical protein [Actinomycetota bacterium]